MPSDDNASLLKREPPNPNNFVVASEDEPLPDCILCPDLPLKPWIQRMVNHVYDERHDKKFNVLAYNLDAKTNTEDLSIIEEWDVQWDDRGGERYVLLPEPGTAGRGNDEGTAVEASKQKSQQIYEGRDSKAGKLLGSIRFGVIVFIKGQVTSSQESCPRTTDLPSNLEWTYLPSPSQKVPKYKNGEWQLYFEKTPDLVRSYPLKAMHVTSYLRPQLRKIPVPRRQSLLPNSSAYQKLEDAECKVKSQDLQK